MTMEATEEEKMKELIRANDIELVRVQCEDINGVSRGFTLDVDYFLTRLNDGIPIPKGIYSFEASKCEMIPDTGVLHEVGYGNCAMYPDISTFRVLPWEKNIASVLSNVGVDCENREGPLFTVSPRNICKLQLDKLKSLGIQLYGAFEFEFYLLSEMDKVKVTDDVNVFSTHSQTKFLPFVKDVIKNIKAIGIRPEVHHNECGPGQQEITCSPEFGLLSPDNGFRFKHIVKEIASKYSLMATFMSQPLQNEAGSSGHYNHSLWDESGECLMYDSSRKYGFSELAENWLSGLLHHSNALMCLAAPFSNCYERINPECNFAPFNTSWGYDNRTVAYRIKNKQSPKLYIENRIAGAAVNPYLLVAGCIIAGMDGIKRKLTLNTEPFSVDITKVTELPENVELLPTTLEASLECLMNNEVFVQQLGPEFIKCFSATRRAEYEAVEKSRNSSNEKHLFKWYRDNYAKFI